MHSVLFRTNKKDSRMSGTGDAGEDDSYGTGTKIMGVMVDSA
jgi:hypothetical protein